MEATGRTAEHPVQRVHEQLDRLALRFVALTAGGAAQRQELIEDHRQDAALATKTSATWGDDRIGLDARFPG